MQEALGRALRRRRRRGKERGPTVAVESIEGCDDRGPGLFFCGNDVSCRVGPMLSYNAVRNILRPGSL